MEYVYLAVMEGEEPSLDRFKIGYSKDPRRRMAQLRTSIPSIRLVSVLQECGTWHQSPGWRLGWLNSGLQGGIISMGTNTVTVSAETVLSDGADLHDAGDFTGALELFERAMAMRPGYSLAHYNAGNALCELGRPKEACKHYREAIEIDGHADAHFNLAIALEGLGEGMQAARHWSAYLRSNRGVDDEWTRAARGRLERVIVHA